MSATAAFAEDLIRLIFHGTTIPSLAQNASGAPATILYISLHTADPGELGTQQTSEASYTGYARVAVSRNGSGWTVTADQVVNAGVIQFAQNTGADQTVTHFGLGLSSTGAGTMLIYSPLTASLLVRTNDEPFFPSGTLIVDLE